MRLKNGWNVHICLHTSYSRKKNVLSIDRVTLYAWTICFRFCIFFDRVLIFLRLYNIILYISTHMHTHTPPPPFYIIVIISISVRYTLCKTRLLKRNGPCARITNFQTLKTVPIYKNTNGSLRGGWYKYKLCNVWNIA